MIPHWESSNAWDTVVLIGPAGRLETPGVAKVSPQSSLSIDAESVPGEDGREIVEVRYQPLTFSVELDMWTAEHLKAMTTLISNYGPAKDRKGERLQVVHPVTALFDINEVILKEITLEPPGKEGQRAVLEFEEWWPEGLVKKRVPKAGSSGAAPTGAAVEPVTLNEVLSAYQPSTETPGP